MQLGDQPVPTAVAPSSHYKAHEKRFKKLTEEQIRSDTGVLDVHALSGAHRERVIEVGTWKWRSLIDGSERQRPVLAFNGYGEHHEGFFVIPDAVDIATQLQIAHACLTEYVEAPHVTNMHQQNEQVADIWHKARQSHPSDPSKAPSLNKLHWGAAGFHYDWTARKYHQENYSPVPPLLQQLGDTCANACGQTLVAEAVIVNFYKKNSTMGGHQDDVEYTMDHPVVSLSLGSHCVFLKGTETKDDAPLEVMLKSGDLAVLSGNSRLSYHGVAKVLPTPFEIDDDSMDTLVAHLVNANEGQKRSESEWREELQAVARYMGTHRININIRQVYPTTTDPNTQPDEQAPKRQKVA